MDRQHRGVHSGVLAAGDKRKSDWDMVGYDADFEGRLRETDADGANREGQGGGCHCDMALFGCGLLHDRSVVPVDGGMTL